MLLIVVLFFILIFAIASTKQACVNTIILFSHRISGKPHFGIWLYAVLFFPGTLIHELSHLLTAEVLRVPVGEINLFPQTEEGFVKLGYVRVAKSDIFRSLLIGSAPFFIGLVVLSLIVSFQFHYLFINPVNLILLASKMLVSLRDPLTWLALYLIIVVSHIMFLSEADRKEIFLIPAVIVIFGGVLWFLRDISHLSYLIIDQLQHLLYLLDIVLCVVLAFNLMLLAILLLLKKVFGKVF